MQCSFAQGYPQNVLSASTLHSRSQTEPQHGRRLACLPSTWPSLPLQNRTRASARRAAARAAACRAPLRPLPCRCQSVPGTRPARTRGARCNTPRLPWMLKHSKPQGPPAASTLPLLCETSWRQARELQPAAGQAPWCPFLDSPRVLSSSAPPCTCAPGHASMDAEGSATWAL
jgi:hypothetical protein